MKVLIVHLSDIHYREGNNVASERLKQVPAAIQNIDVDIAAVVVIASGDIAFSGRQEEYTVAQRDLADMLNSIRSRFENIPVHFAAVPGNHDCDFTDSGTQTRALLLHGLTRSAGPPDDTTLQLCCSVHNHFFSFLDANQTVIPTHARGRVYYDFLIPVGNGARPHSVFQHGVRFNEA